MANNFFARIITAATFYFIALFIIRFFIGIELGLFVFITFPFYLAGKYAPIALPTYGIILSIPAFHISLKKETDQSRIWQRYEKANEILQAISIPLKKSIIFISITLPIAIIINKFGRLPDSFYPLAFGYPYDHHVLMIINGATWGSQNAKPIYIALIATTYITIGSSALKKLAPYVVLSGYGWMFYEGLKLI